MGGLSLWLQEWLLSSSVRGSYGGVLLSDTATGREADDFVVFTTQALQLIEQSDPRRFRRVQREVRYISNTFVLSAAQYRRETPRCSVDFSQFRAAPDAPGYEWRLARYACAIVHEATHGRLYSLGISYGEATWERVERLCRREEARFASRLRSERYDFSSLVPEFDPAVYREHRAQSRGQQVVRLLRQFARRIEAKDK